MPRGRVAVVERTCPPEITALGISRAVLADVDRALAAAAPATRLALRSTVAAMSAGLPVPPPLAAAVRSLLLTVAYEQPEAHRLLGYDPRAWISATAARRAPRWGG